VPSVYMSMENIKVKLQHRFLKKEVNVKPLLSSK